MKKTLYGLKQSPREWNEVLDTFMKSEGFEQSRADPCIYSKKGNYHMLVGIYVDDIVTVGKGDELENFRKILQEKFGIKEGGPLEWYLRIAVHKYPDWISEDISR